MQLFKNLILVIWLSNEMLTAFAQEKKQPAPDINSIFGDLPVDNVQRNSVLKKNENPQEKISRNMLVKASTNRRSIYFGEPVLATYELYTTLESRSQVSVKPSVTGSGVEELTIDEYSPRQVRLDGRKTYTQAPLKVTRCTCSLCLFRKKTDLRIFMVSRENLKSGMQLKNPVSRQEKTTTCMLRSVEPGSLKI